MDKVLKQLFDTKYTTTYARNRIPGEGEYVGPTLFPTQTTNKLSYEIIKGAKRRPVAANVTAFNTEADIASRPGTEKQTGQIPGIKRKIPLDEEFLVALNRSGLGDNEYVRNEIFNDMDDMVDSCWARAEKMRIDAIAEGKIVIADEKIKATIDYGVPAEHKETLSGEALWSDHVNSNPIEDIQAWDLVMRQTVGVPMQRVLTSSTVAAHVVQNVNVRKMVYGSDGSTRAITLNDVNQLLIGLGLPRIAVYDVMVDIEDDVTGVITTERFFPEEKVVLMPNGSLGEFLVGPTPESLLDGAIAEKSGIYGIVYNTGKDPVGIMTKAALTGIPTFPRAGEVFQATVI